MTNDSEFTTKNTNDSGEVLFGGGGTADCYKRVIGNRAYCIKRPKAAWRHSDDYMNLFRKEFTLGIELEHPNIVRYFDYGEDEKGPFIKMDYVDGENLEQFATSHPDFFKNKKNRKQILDELTDALAYLHGKQMLHLDLKPGNILITHNGHHVKLIDMGFGWAEGFLHEAGFSRDFCAPEQLNNKTDLIAAATDIYALGKIMQRFGLTKGSVVNRCLKENPKERYQSVEALRKAIQPKPWPLFLSVALVLGILLWTLSTTIRPTGKDAVEHDTLYIVQVDTVFITEPKNVLTLDDSLALFKEELKGELAPTFGYWYMMIDNMFENQPNWSNDLYLESAEFYMDKAITISQGVIKEKINTLTPSGSSRRHYEEAATSVIDHYMKDYRNLRKRLEAS